MSWIRRLLGNLGMSPDGDLGAQPPFPAGPSTSPAAEKAPLGPGGARLAETLRASGIDPATTESLERLAATLLGSRVWYFWWD